MEGATEHRNTPARTIVRDLPFSRRDALSPVNNKYPPTLVGFILVASRHFRDSCRYLATTTRLIMCNVTDRMETLQFDFAAYAVALNLHARVLRWASAALH